jgi:regulator-associated protein of mTOR
MTSSFWINEDSSSLFLVGCGDGSVKIWSNILESNGKACTTPPSLMSSFYAAPMRAGDFDCALVLEWQPYSGILLAGGSNKYIRCWDLEAEQITNKIDTNSEAYVTTMTTAWDYDTLGLGPAPQGYQGIGKDIIVAGHSDGSLKIFDIRMTGVASEMRTRRGMQRATSYNEHKSWVVNTAFTSYSNRYELVSGTLSGEIKAWDLRMSSSIRTIEAQRSKITTLDFHRKIPIVATGSNAQFIKILTLDGDTLQVLRYHEKIANHRIGPVSCLAFHPNKPLLAAGAIDSYIGLYETKQEALN